MRGPRRVERRNAPASPQRGKRNQPRVVSEAGSYPGKCQNISPRPPMASMEAQDLAGPMLRAIGKPILHSSMDLLLSFKLLECTPFYQPVQCLWSEYFSARRQ